MVLGVGIDLVFAELPCRYVVCKHNIQFLVSSSSSFREAEVSPNSNQESSTGPEESRFALPIPLCWVHHITKRPGQPLSVEKPGHETHVTVGILGLNLRYQHTGDDVDNLICVPGEANSLSSKANSRCLSHNSISYRANG